MPKLAAADSRASGLARATPKLTDYFDVRRRKRRGRRRRASRTNDMKLIERALELVARADGRVTRYEYAPIDLWPPGRRRGQRVIYLQQRHWGLPVYDGRRSVVFPASGKPYVTGDPIGVGPLRALAPGASAEAAVRAAVNGVLTSPPKTRLQQLAPMASRNDTVAFRWPGLEKPISAHLSVFFVAQQSRLAWVVTFGLPRGLRYEVLLDADTLRVLKRRTLSYHLDGCLKLGRGGAEAQATLALDPAWLPPTAERLTCLYADAEWKPHASNGLICGSAPSDKRSLNVLGLASRGLVLLEAAGARMGTPSGAKLVARVYGNALTEAFLAALARSDSFQLYGLEHGGVYSHPAYDPTIVLHEMSHVVLSFNLGGSRYPDPFEPIGESGAVAEGLADFLGLTLWDRIRREVTPVQPQTWVVGASFLPQPRDYKDYLREPPLPVAASGSIHAHGMSLCGALLFARFRLLAGGATLDRAEQGLWSAVCVGLQGTEHQGERPLFCCISKAIGQTIDATLRPTVVQALQDAGLPSQCLHLQ
jgi:hypothetical protein